MGKRSAKKLRILVPPEYIYVLEEIELLVETKKKMGITTSVSYELMKLAKKALFEDTGPRPTKTKIPKIIQEYVDQLEFNLLEGETDGLL